MPVTYNTRFYFVFMTDAGREMRINIKQAGFSGTAVQRPMGATPVLKRDSGGNGIYGTSLEITAECNTDNEFAVLYTSDAREFLVELVDEDADETLWTGFVSPELYSAPEIAPPYDVRIVAVDGLGELKRDNFAAAGRQSLYTHLSTILSHSGLGAAQSDIVIVDTLACTTPSVSAGNVLTGISVDLDYMADEGSTCYEVLEAILETLNLTITRHANKWLLMRPSDVEVSGGAVAAHTAAGTSVSLPAVTCGSMSVTDWWPVGKMATEIQPARNRISVALPYRLSVSMFNDGNLVDPNAWTSWQVTWKEINGVGGEQRPWITQSAGYVSQTIAVQWFDGALPLRVLLASPQDADHEVAVSIVVELQGSSHTYYLSQRNANYLRWNTDRTNIDITLPPLSGYAYPIVPLDKFSQFEYIIDGIPESGQLSIQISAHYQAGIGDPPVVVGLVSMLQQTVYGYKDDIVIDNGARGAGDDAVMAFGDAPYAQNAVRAIRNVTSASGNVTSEWETARFEGGLLEVVAMERALDVALPRQLTKGTLNVPFGAALPAVIVNPDGLAMQIERYSWRLVDDEVEVELLSVPSGNVEIVSDSVTPMTEQEAARATGTTPASGGGGTSPSPGGGRDQFFEAVNDPTTQEIVGAKALYDLHIIQTAADPEADPPVAEVTKNVTDILKHLALQVINPGESNEETVLVSDIAFASLYSITAGGIGQGGGTGGGSLAGLADVTLDEPAEGDILRYDSTTSHWINTPLEVALSGLTDVAIAATPANGQVLMWDAEAHKWKPGSASGEAAGTLADLTDVAIGTQTDGQALVWDSNLGKWKPGNAGGGGSSWKIYTGTSSTGASTKAKVATTETFPVDGEGHPMPGTFVWIKFSATNSASSPTLNVNGTGAYRIWYNSSLLSSSNLTRVSVANRYTGYMFDGTYWCWWSHGYDMDTTYTNKDLGFGYGTCATAAATIEKAVTSSNYVATSYGYVSVMFDEDVPAGATMNINSKGAKPIYHGSAAITDGVIKAGDLATFIYTGTYYRLVSLDRDFSPVVPVDQLLEPIVDATTEEITGAKALYDLYITQSGDSLKNISEILRHLSLQTVDNATVLVSDIAFASLGSIVAGGTSTSGGSSGGSLATLSDVALSGTVGGDTLVYNGTTSHWENTPLALTSLADVAIGSPSGGQVLMWDAGLGKWRPGTVSSGGGGGGGGIGSISLTMPTGFSVSGSPLTADGTLAVSFASGYSLPLTNDVSKGVTAYGWGDHHDYNYMTQSTADGRYGAGLGMYNSRIYLFNKNGSNIGDYITAGNLKEMLVGSSNATLATTEDLSGYATQSWVNGKGYITSSALDGYATQTWVTNKGYITSSALSGYATQTWVGQQGFLTSAVTSLNSLTGSVTLGQGSNISITKSGSTITIANTYSYTPPSDGANKTITAANGRVLSAITVNSLGHVTSVDSKTLAKADIPSLDYLPISGGTLTGSLTVQGNVTATGNVVAGSASDRRLKKDIRSISLTEASDLLSVLNPVTFQWNDKAGELGGLSGVSRGFLADEYLDILPNAGRKIWGEYDAIDYNQVIPYLVAGWQQQNLRIRILEGEIADLKFNNELMRRRLKESNVIQ